jgi:hypothetical protein
VIRFKQLVVFGFLIMNTSCKISQDSSQTKDIIGPAGSVFRVASAVAFAPNLKGLLTGALQGSGKELCAGFGNLDGAEKSIGIWFKSGQSCEGAGSTLSGGIVYVFKNENIFNNGGDTPKYVGYEQIDFGSWTRFEVHITGMCTGRMSSSCDLVLTGPVPAVVPKISM